MTSCEDIILKKFEKHESLNSVKIINGYETNMAEMHENGHSVY